MSEQATTTRTTTTITTDDSGRLARHEQQQAAKQRRNAELMARARWIGATGARPRRVRKTEARQAGVPRRVGAPMAQSCQLAALLALVAQYAIDPTCPRCGGPAELRLGTAGTIDQHVEHRTGCDLLESR